MTWVLDCLNDNAGAIQAVGSVLAIMVATLVAGWQTQVSRRDQANARDRAARVLAMELLPTVKTIHADLARALKGWNERNLDGWRDRDIGDEADVLERALDRLSVFDEETIRPMLGMLRAIRDYRRLQMADRDQTIEAHLDGEAAKRRSWLDAACCHAAEAVKRLGEVADV